MHAVSAAQGERLTPDAQTVRQLCAQAPTGRVQSCESRAERSRYGDDDQPVRQFWDGAGDAGHPLVSGPVRP